MKNKTLLAASLALMMALPMQAQMFFGKPKEVSDSAYLAQAQTPPMGWNSWNKFGCNVSEKLIMDMADKMQVNTILQKTLGIDIEEKFLDATDALAIALCHHYQMTNPLAGLNSGSSWEKFIADNPGRIKNR